MTKTSKRKNKICKAAVGVEKIKQEVQLTVAAHFACPIYLTDRPDFLEIVTEVSDEYLEKVRADREIDDIYPVIMSGSYYDDPRLAKFSEFIGGTSWNILAEQGYAMQDKVVSFTEMWTQEHHKHSAMDQHTHGYGSQIVGFYFLETPENSSRLIFHDPRMGKVQIDLPESDVSQATIASKMINFEPRPGLMVFANSWLAHSFTRHGANEPIKFVHFNLTVDMLRQQDFKGSPPAAEVI